MGTNRRRSICNCIWAKAAQKLAENDFNEKGIKDVVGKGVGALQSTIKIAKHLKGPRVKVSQGVRFEDDNQTLLIPNDEGEYLKVSKQEYEEYLKYPEELLNNIAGSPKNNQSVSVGLIEKDEVQVESIGSNEAGYFVSDDQIEGDHELLFPEMQHGDEVELIGNVTRSNNQTNNMGFKYQGHILACRPRRGTVENYKTQLFQECILRGKVQRIRDDSIKGTLVKPRLIFEELEVIHKEGKQTKLI